MRRHRRLAEDVRRFLEHEPVVPAEAGSLYRLRKFVRRYRLQCTAAGLVLLALVGGLVGAAIGLDAANVARREAQDAAAKLGEANRFLGYGAQLRSLLARRSELYPPWPSNVPGLRRWVGEATDLHDALPDIRLVRAQLDKQLRGGQPIDVADQLLADSLRMLEGDLEHLVAAGGALAEVRRDLVWAENIQACSIGEHSERWREAREAILASNGESAHEAYAGFDLAPQMGLVPLGVNPRTKLWEFYHLRSADEGTPIPFDAALLADGRPDPGWGIIFVLLPEGSAGSARRYGVTKSRATTRWWTTRGTRWWTTRGISSNCSRSGCGPSS